MKARLLVVLLAAAAACAASADDVSWSDGRIETGRIVLGPGSRLRLHDGERVREWVPSEVACIDFDPLRGSMERAWRFVEAGKTAKEYTGEAYPVLDLGTVVACRDGSSATGRLMTAAIYLEQGAKTSKIVIRRQLEGKPGERLADLVYPARIAFDAPADAPPVAERTFWIRAPIPDDADPADVALLWRRPFPMAAHVWKSAENGAFAAERLGSDPVLALRTATSIRVGWSGELAGPLKARLAQGVADIRDFFDDRRLLAAAADPDDPSLATSLVLVSRAGSTTLDGAATQPWRLEVWRWRIGESEDDLLLSTRAVLFRGIRAPDGPVPEILLDPLLVP
ncbi:MAG: hypothetical protein ACOX5G_06720 [Kiritimatiellia bacterium]|jgi:tellurite resistance protein